MNDIVRAFLYAALTVLLTLGVAWLATYAGSHPEFAKNILIPILSVLGFVAIWGFFHTMIRSGKR